jgi:hypothetical protein
MNQLSEQDLAIAGKAMMKDFTPEQLAEIRNNGTHLKNMCSMKGWDVLMSILADRRARLLEQLLGRRPDELQALIYEQQSINAIDALLEIVSYEIQRGKIASSVLA